MKLVLSHLIIKEMTVSEVTICTSHSSSVFQCCVCVCMCLHTCMWMGVNTPGDEKGKRHCFKGLGTQSAVGFEGNGNGRGGVLQRTIYKRRMHKMYKKRTLIRTKKVRFRVSDWFVYRLTISVLFCWNDSREKY